MKRFILILVSFVLLCSLVGCGDTAEPPKELTETATFEDFTLTLGEAERFTDNNGNEMLRVHAVYTNNGQDPYYAASCFAVRAFQNDVELDRYFSVDGEEDNMAKEIRNGQSIDVLYFFALGDNSEVEVLIGEPTADMKSIGRRVYSW